MDLLPTTTAVEESHRGARVAVLPVGSFEQHGEHLPLATDSIIAHAICSRLAIDYGLLQLPALTLGCSHEHEGLHTGTVSISAHTLYDVVTDILASLERAGIDKIALISGHGGNYVLSNIVQETNVARPRSLLYPGKTAIQEARDTAGCVTTETEDMHAGEWETSIMLHITPHLVRDSWSGADFSAPQRPDLLTLGVPGYSSSGVIGRPSLASAVKGKAILDALSANFADRLKALD